MSTTGTHEKPRAASRSPKLLKQERCARSLTWRVIYALGSLQLALILLATIAVACAVATVYESNFNAKIAQAYIYKAPWFIFWLAILCINLFAVTLTRWPWQKKHAGFIITHYGIILLLIGAMVGQKLGLEGNVTLKKDAPPVSRLVTNRSIIQIQSPTDSWLYLYPFDAELAKPSEKRPKRIAVPGSSMVILADGYSGNMVREPRLVESDAPEAGPGVLLKLTSARLGQSMDFAFGQGGRNEADFFGLARIRLLPELPADGLREVTETRMVFAKYDPVINSEGTPNPLEVRLSEDGSKVTLTPRDGANATYRLSEVLGKPLQAGSSQVTVVDYWPDFEMRDGKPATKSDSPQNPAALVRIVAKQMTERTDVPELLLAVSTNGGPAEYALVRDGMVTQRGELREGEKIVTGWADWEAAVTGLATKALVVEEPQPGPDGVEGIPGFRARLVAADGRSGNPQWVESGSVSALYLDGEVVRIGYGLETKPVDFSIALKDFHVPRDEGTDQAADFIATVEFRDLKTGETREGKIRMNHPASFPGHWWNVLTGVNYKFSQAEWNPRDLGETTLQVLYDPGWLFKWTGSLAICVGIFMMFYFKPKSGPKS